MYLFIYVFLLMGVMFDMMMMMMMMVKKPRGSQLRGPCLSGFPFPLGALLCFGEVDECRWPPWRAIILREDVERTPRDQQVSGPPTAGDLLLKRPPPPRPVGGMPMPRQCPDNPDLVSDDGADGTGTGDSRPEQRWPMLAEYRLQGPRLPSGRFADSSSRSRSRSRSGADSSSSSATAHADSSGRDSRPEAPPVPARHAAGRAPADDEDDVASGSWNDTSLDLAGPALAQAIETLLGLYRSQLLRTDLLTNRELGGKVGGLRRHLSFKPCKTSSGRGGPGELADL